MGEPLHVGASAEVKDTTQGAAKTPGFKPFAKCPSYG